MKCKNCGEEIFWGDYSHTWLHRSNNVSWCTAGTRAEPEPPATERALTPRRGHLTIIYSDDEQTSVVDVPQIEDFIMETVVPESQSLYRGEYEDAFVHVEQNVSFSGKPIKTEDGVEYTVITRKHHE